MDGISIIYISIGSTYHLHGLKYKTPYHIRHPNYDITSIYYDVGMVKTTSNMYIDKIVTRVIVLATKEYVVPEKSYITTMGWGNTKENGNISSVLRAVKITVIPLKVCQVMFGNRAKLTSDIFCAVEPEGGKDTCYGDSGGPAVDKHNVQVGIISSGTGCGHIALPSVYTNIASVRDWIREVAEV